MLKVNRVCIPVFSLPICLVMLHMQSDKHQSRPLVQADNSTGGAADPQGIKLFPAAWFNHAMQFFEVEAGVAPELWQVKGVKKLEHFGGSLARGQLSRHDGLIECGANFNLHRPTFCLLCPLARVFLLLWMGANP